MVVLLHLAEEVASEQETASDGGAGSKDAPHNLLFLSGEL